MEALKKLEDWLKAQQPTAAEAEPFVREPLAAQVPSHHHGFDEFVTAYVQI